MLKKDSILRAQKSSRDRYTNMSVNDISSSQITYSLPVPPTCQIQSAKTKQDPTPGNASVSQSDPVQILAARSRVRTPRAALADGKALVPVGDDGEGLPRASEAAGAGKSAC